jgi:hypothetical protein
VPLLVYNANVFELTPEVAQELFDKGVVIVDPYGDTDLALAPEHTIDEVEPLATVIERADAPSQSTIPRLKVRGTGWWPFPSPGHSARGTVLIPEDVERRDKKNL